jgi:hypothetical protein
VFDTANWGWMRFSNLGIDRWPHRN